MYPVRIIVRLWGRGGAGRRRAPPRAFYTGQGGGEPGVSASGFLCRYLCGGIREEEDAAASSQALGRRRKGLIPKFRGAQRAV